MKKILTILLLSIAVNLPAQTPRVLFSQEPPTNAISAGDLLVIAKQPGTANEKIYKMIYLDFFNQLVASGMIDSNLVALITGTTNGINSHISSVENAASALATRAGNLEGATNGLSTNAVASATLFVDSLIGNDTTAIRGVPSRPWQTISNALWACRSGDTVLIRPGTYTNRTLAVSVSDKAPLLLVNKTNVTVLGDGPNTRIYSDVTNESTMLILSNCVNVKLAGLSFEGTRLPDGTLSGIFTSVIGLGGNCGNLEIADCSFRNFMRHGICKVDSAAGLFATNEFIHECTFVNMGSTNTADFAADDGTCILMGSKTIISNNRFENCNRGIEWQDDALINSGSVISGNIFNSIWSYCVFLIPDNTRPVQQNLVIANNSFSMLATNVFLSPSVAISMTGNADITIANNLFSYCAVGLEVEDNQTNAERIIISHNQFRQVFNPILMDHLNTNWVRDIQIDGNVFNDCADRIEVQGVRNLRFANNQFIDVGAISGVPTIIVRPANSAGAQGVSSNTVFQGNWFYTTGGTVPIGIQVLAGCKNTKILDNWFGPGITTAVDFQGSGEFSQSADVLGIGTAVTPAFSFTLATNSAAFCAMEATGISTNAFDAAAFQLYATFRNTNGFTSNIVEGAHSYIFTNSTDAGFYADVTNAGGNTINFVVGGSSGKNVNWRTKCKATIISK